MKTPEDITTKAKAICDQFAYAISLITGTRCAVCIKVLESNPIEIIDPNSRIAISTLCRDSTSERKRQCSDEPIHWLDKNTDFANMFGELKTPNGGKFLSNNLPREHDYESTSFDVYGKPKTPNFPFLRWILRQRTWTLPYKSTMGAAIYPSVANNNERLLGFLCVDSFSRYVFNTRYDLDILRNMSEALYPMMLRWYELVRQQPVQASSPVSSAEKKELSEEPEPHKELSPTFFSNFETGR